MGLDTTHGCWHGAYSAFMRWREKLAEVAGLPPLGMMEGFYNRESWWTLANGRMTSLDDVDCDGRVSFTAAHNIKGLPISWDCLKPDVLYELLWHSDCDGKLASAICAPLADRLTELLPLLPSGDAAGHIGNWRDKTKTFIDGLREAAEAGEDVEFH